MDASFAGQKAAAEDIVRENRDVLGELARR